MLIVALVLAVIGLAALVTAVVTSNELIAWVCIAASVIGVLLLIVDALRERSRGEIDEAPAEEYEAEAEPVYDEDYPEESAIVDRVDDDTVTADDTVVFDDTVTADDVVVERSDEVAGEDRNSR